MNDILSAFLISAYSLSSDGNSINILPLGSNELTLAFPKIVHCKFLTIGSRPWSDCSSADMLFQIEPGYIFNAGYCGSLVTIILSSL